MDTEIWKEIDYYKDYKISNLGNVKSLKFSKERILKYNITKSGYCQVILCKNGKTKEKKIHQLVAIAFLNHNIRGHEVVINHKNFIKTDNRAENLELVTQRENTNRKHCKSSSEYVGVYWNKKLNKWQSSILINKKSKYLGVFNIEIDAHLAYQKELTKQH